MPAFDVVGPKPAIAAFARRDRRAVIDADAYERARIEAGVPRRASTLDERTIPQEAGLELRRGVVHEGLLRRPGARVPHRLARPREPAPAAAARADGALAAGCRRSRSTATRSARSRAPRAASRSAMLRREVEPGARVDVGRHRGGRRSALTTVVTRLLCVRGERVRLEELPDRRARVDLLRRHAERSRSGSSPATCGRRR